MNRSSLTYDQLMALYHQILAQTRGLPFARVEPGHNRALGGWLIPGGDVIVEQLGKGLCAHAQLFPELPGKGEELLAKQRAADGWLAVFHLFNYMARKTWETYLVHQVEATQESFRILDAIKDQGERQDGQGAFKRNFLRAAAVIEAYILVDTYYRKLRKNRQVLKDARKAARDAATGKPGIEPSPPKPKSRQRRVAERLQAERADDQIEQIFHHALAMMRSAKQD